MDLGVFLINVLLSGRMCNLFKKRKAIVAGVWRVPTSDAVATMMIKTWIFFVYISFLRSVL